MTSLISFVQAYTLDLTPEKMRLSPCVWSTFTTLNQVHRVWRYYRLCQTVHQPATFGQLVAGFVEKTLFTPPFVIRLAAQFLMVATRLLECARQQATVTRSGQRLVAALKGEYAPPLCVEWEKGSLSGFMSPSTVYWWKSRGITLWQRIERIALCILNLGKHIFKLSMLIMDVVEEVECLFKRPGGSIGWINESYLNLGKCLDAIVENKEELLAGLTDNRGLIERLSENTPISYSKMHQVVSHALQYAENFNNLYKKGSELMGKSALECGARGCNGFLVVGGCASACN